MTNEQLDREIERAARNTRKLAALTDEHERSARETATPGAADARPVPHAPRTPYAVRG